MSIRSFEQEDLKDFFLFGRAPKKKSWSKIRSIVLKKLDILEYAYDLKDLRSPPGNRLESLRGKFTGIL